VRHVSRSSDLLHVEINRAMVSHSGLKTGGGVTQMIHVASSRRLHRCQVKDGRVDATCYIKSF
jgi:hypothetical protein